jgi:hypothetical protein
MLVIIEGEHDVESHVDGGEQQKSGKPRKGKTPIPLEKSLSFAALPYWIKPLFDTKLIPTLLDIFGAADDPWDLDPHADYFLSVVQDQIKVICPREYHNLQLERSDRIYAIVIVAGSSYT